MKPLLSPMVGGYPSAGALAFSPVDVAGLQLWLDASDTATITESGGSVSQWDDKSGNANHVSQGTAANQPTTGVATQNSLNVVRFNSDWMQSATATVIPQPYTIFAVALHDNNSVRLLASQDATAGASITRFSFAPTKWQWNAGSDLEIEAPLDEYQIGTAVFNGVSSEAFLNGALGASGDIGSLDLRLLTLGATYDGVLTYDGDIAEVLIYDTALSTADREAIEQFLADKWSISLG